MKVLSLRNIKNFCKKHPSAEQPLLARFHEVTKVKRKQPQDVLKLYATASILGKNRVVFRIKWNHYRLICHVSYQNERIRIKFIWTHKEYDKIDAKTVSMY